MKVLFVAPRFHTNQWEIVRLLLNRGHQVTFHVAVVGPTEDHSLCRPTAPPQSRLSIWYSRFFDNTRPKQTTYFPSFSKYWHIMCGLKPDLIIIRLHNRVYSYLAALYGRLMGAKIVFYSQHEALALSLRHTGGIVPWLRALKFRIPLLVFDAAWMTPLLSNLGKSGSLPRRWYYVPFAVPIGECHDSGDRLLKILCVGKYQERKNQLLLLDAVSVLSTEFDFRLTLVGEVTTTEHRKYRAQAAQYVCRNNLQHCVEFRDNVPYASMLQIYREHDLFVLPSRNEPAAISPLEAMGQGLPVILSDTNGTRSYVRIYQNGLVFESEDLDSLRQCIKAILVNRVVLQLMSREAWSFANQAFSASAYVQYFNAMLQSQFPSLSERL